MLGLVIFAAAETASVGTSSTPVSAFTVGGVTIVITQDDLWQAPIAFGILALLLGVFLYRPKSVQTGNTASSSRTNTIAIVSNEPKRLRYGTEKTGGAWDATGPGYLPDPDPLVDFDLGKASVRNYVYVNKVLRYPYFQTMAHQSMHINDWIEIDKEYEWYLSEKARVIKEKGNVVVDSLPENDAACTELLESLVDYLPKRYPTLFEYIPSPEDPSSKTYGIFNKVTGERFTAIHNLKGVPALLVVSRLVQDDFLMAREREDGKIYLVGGLIVFPGSYLLSEKINMPLSELHTSVPHFNKMLMSVERTMSRFAPDRPFERSSWMIVDDRQLFWHNIVSGSMPSDMHPQDLFLRIDHQTFRKLPKTKGIMFGVHSVLKRMADLADSPLVPALIAKLHANSDKELMEYKWAEKYYDRLMPYLQELTQRQVARGLVKSEDTEDVAKFRDRA